jgi:hypothetical protein
VLHRGAERAQRLPVAQISDMVAHPCPPRAFLEEGGAVLPRRWRERSSER